MFLQHIKDALNTELKPALLELQFSKQGSWSGLARSLLGGQSVTVSASHYSRNFCCGSAPSQGLMGSITFS